MASTGIVEMVVAEITEAEEDLKSGRSTLQAYANYNYRLMLFAERQCSKEACAELAKAIDHPDLYTRSCIVTFLKVLSSDTALPPLIHALGDESSTIRKGAASGLAAKKDPRAVEPLITVLDDPDEEVREAAASALEAVTGKSFIIGRQNATKWCEWWAKNRAKLALASPPQSAEAPNKPRRVLLCSKCLSEVSSYQGLCDSCARPRRLFETSSEEERQQVQSCLDRILKFHGIREMCVATGARLLAAAGFMATAAMIASNTNIQNNEGDVVGSVLLVVLVVVVPSLLVAGALLALSLAIGLLTSLNRTERNYRREFPEQSRERAIANELFADMEETKAAYLHKRLGIKCRKPG